MEHNKVVKEDVKLSDVNNLDYATTPLESVKRELKENGGFFFVVEGPDYSGKSTQVAMLSEKLRAKDIPHIVAREPGATEFGLAIRENIFKFFGSVTPQSEALLLMAAKIEMLEQVVRPALEEGKIVICDRYTPSMIAYQGYGHGLGRTWVEQLISAMEDKHIHPDATAFIQISMAEIDRRRQERGIDNSIDAASEAFRYNVLVAYNQLPHYWPNSHVVRAGLSRSETTDGLMDILIKAISAKISSSFADSLAIVLG